MFHRCRSKGAVTKYSCVAKSLVDVRLRVRVKLFYYRRRCASYDAFSSAFDYTAWTKDLIAMQNGKRKGENGGTARRIGNFWFSRVRDDKSVPEGRYEVRNGNGNSIARRDEARGSDTRTSRRPTERKSRQTDFILRSFFLVSARPSAYPTTFTPRFLLLFIFEQPVVEMVVLLAYPFRLKVRGGSAT